VEEYRRKTQNEKREVYWKSGFFGGSSKIRRAEAFCTHCSGTAWNCGAVVKCQNAYDQNRPDYELRLKASAYLALAA